MCQFDEINPQWNGNVRCAKAPAQSMFVREVLSHSREWLEPGSENGGIYTVVTSPLVPYSLGLGSL